MCAECHLLGRLEGRLRKGEITTLVIFPIIIYVVLHVKKDFNCLFFLLSQIDIIHEL